MAQLEEEKARRRRERSPEQGKNTVQRSRFSIRRRRLRSALRRYYRIMRNFRRRLQGELCCCQLNHCLFLFLVRCLPGYPFKCPKLQITPEKGLSEADAKKLLSLFQDLVLLFRCC
ncbi:hypothetical protein JHK87_030737 [Glycine soja]|nr:hypothetical protein JHK87_030737 [Glycine soja]